MRRAAGGAVVFRGKLSGQAADADTGDQVQAADFSAFKTDGKYYVDVPGVGRSWEFAIGPDVYSRAFYLAMRAYYGQRCGIAVDLAPDFPGFKHAACHLEGAWHASSGKTGPRDIGQGLARRRRLRPLHRSIPASPPARCCGRGRCSPATSRASS